MRESIEVTVAKVKGLSTKELDRAAEGLVRRQRWNAAELIAHLAEISRRKVHLALGYDGLFHYCVDHLGLSQGSTWLRVQVANVCGESPELLESLGRSLREGSGSGP